MVFWVILGIAIGNLLLGFALAVFLNRRYQTLSLGQIGSPSDCSPEALSCGEIPRSISEEPASGQLPAQRGGVVRREASPVGLEVPGQELGGHRSGSPGEAFSPEVSGELLEEEELTGGALSGILTEEPFQQPSAESDTVGQAEPEAGAGDSLQGDPTALSAADRLYSDDSETAETLSQPPGSPPEGAPLLAKQTKTDPQRPEEPSSSVPESPPNPDTIRRSSSDGQQPEPITGQKMDVVSAPGMKVSQKVSPPSPKDKLLDVQHPEASDAAPQVSGEWEDVRRAVAPSGRPPETTGPLPGVAKPQTLLSGADGLERRGGSPDSEELSPVQSPPGRPLPPEESLPSGPAGEAESWQSSSHSESSSLGQSGPEASLERALAQWQAEATRYFEQLSRTRTKVQRFSGAAKMEEIHTSWQEIHRAGQDYLTTARPVREAFSQFAHHRPSTALLRDHLNTLGAKEETLIELSQELMPTSAEASDSHLLCQQLLQHTDRLMEANRKVQTALEAVRRGPTDQPPPAETSGRARPANGLLLDDSIREKLAAWWDEQRRRPHRLSVIMLEVDDFAEIQEEFGPSLTEGLLRAIERVLALESEEAGFLVPLSGPRFARFCANRWLDQAVDMAEHLRQTLMATRFYRKKAELRISVSCGVTEATRDDTPETVLERAEVALLQARRYGKGRTFSHDGYFPMPVALHPLGISPKQMEI